MLISGTVIADRYRIVKVIGEGGMGVVYEAEHAHIGKKVALKVLNQEFSKNAEALERFQQEAKIAGTIGHLNICEVMDFGVTEQGLPYLVMEFLDGESLADILEREVKLPVDVAMGIIYQILDALEEVHAKGILHRDLKPENVFITNVKGHGLVVKLLDFGISKIMKPGAESMRLTKTGAMVGTPYYMSPEHIRARSDLDQRADLYSCGVMFYEMITGEVPYKGSGYSQIIAAILEEPCPDAKKFIPDLAPDFQDFVQWGMERDPAKRPQSAADYKARIRELQGGPEGLGPLPRKSKHFVRTKLDSMVISPETREKPVTWKILTIAGGVVGVILITLAVVLSVYLAKRSDGEEKKDHAASSSDTGSGRTVFDRTAAPEKKAPPPEEPPPESKMVTITLTGAPDGVGIVFGKSVIPREVLEIARGSSPVKIKITAEGYIEREVEIIPNSDMEIDGSLLPAKPSKKTHKGGKKKTTGGEQSTKKKEKLDHVWNYPG